jgi:hypothetical protein
VSKWLLVVDTVSEHGWRARRQRNKEQVFVFKVVDRWDESEVVEEMTESEGCHGELMGRLEGGLRTVLNQRLAHYYLMDDYYAAAQGLTPA